MEISANFAFLKQEFPHAAESASYAERHVYGDPRASCFHARHALERLVMRVYRVDKSLSPPKVTNLDGYLNETAFRDLVPEVIWQKAEYIRQVGNVAVHGNKSPAPQTALDIVRELFHVQRVFQVTDLYLNAIKALARMDTTVALAICVVPEFVYKNCRPLSRVSTGHGSRPSKREVKLRRQIRDLFGEYDSKHYDFSLDFRRQIKARAMEYQIPIQIIRETTLRLSNENPFGRRGLTYLSDRAWNLSTAFLYKSGKKPWKLAGVREGVSYVGIAFKRTDETGSTACSAAQMFLNDGDGIVFLGDYGSWYSPETKQCHLSRDAARTLLAGVLETYEQLHGKELEEVFLHCRSSFDEDEWLGYQDACPRGVRLVGIRVASDHGLRAYRLESRPVMRGTFWKVSDRAAYLWASGFKLALRTYEGFDVPEPLRIEVQQGDADITEVAKDIFGLTKLNYNACRLGENQPVTIHFSDAVGEILVANRGTKHFLPNFKYYV